MSTNDTLTEKHMNFTFPQEYTDRDVLFKIQKKKEIEPKINKFRSFAISTLDNCIVIKNKKIHMSHLFTILKEHGLPETMPIIVSLGPLMFVGFDWKPAAYNGPTVWYFKWNNIDCSITANSRETYMPALYIRVHDLTSGVGEKIINELTDELLKFWTNPLPNKSLIVYTTQGVLNGYRWIQNCTRLHRDMETIYITKHVKDTLINQLAKFYISSDMYDRYGITWKRVHLFHGPPGSGKTSTVLALASIFGKNICKLTLTPDLNSQHIELLFQSIPEESFLLLEDVDALFTERTSKTSIDFSTLLNCMDGLTTKRGLVLFMTTNHVTKLDQAFVRPGRVDMCIEFNLPGKEELREALKVLGKNYEHEHEEFLEKHTTDMSIASLQKHLFECMMEEKKSILF